MFLLDDIHNTDGIGNGNHPAVVDISLQEMEIFSRQALYVAQGQHHVGDIHQSVVIDVAHVVLNMPVGEPILLHGLAIELVGHVGEDDVAHPHLIVASEAVFVDIHTQEEQRVGLLEHGILHRHDHN